MVFPNSGRLSTRLERASFRERGAGIAARSAQMNPTPRGAGREIVTQICQKRLQPPTRLSSSLYELPRAQHRQGSCYQNNLFLFQVCRRTYVPIAQR
jgi:hypothetical protein